MARRPQPHELLDRGLAKAYFKNLLPEADSPTGQDADKEVSALVSIGRYTVDRWAAEEQWASEHPGRPYEELTRATGTVSWGHLTDIEQQAGRRLLAYTARHSTLVSVAAARSELEASRSPWERVWSVRWFVVEAAKVVFAILLLLAIASMMRCTSPAFRHAAHEEVDSAIGADPTEVPAKPNSSAAATASGAQGRSGTQVAPSSGPAPRPAGT